MAPGKGSPALLWDSHTLGPPLTIRQASSSLPVSPPFRPYRWFWQWNVLKAVSEILTSSTFVLKIWSPLWSLAVTYLLPFCLFTYDIFKIQVNPGSVGHPGIRQTSYLEITVFFSLTWFLGNMWNHFPLHSWRFSLPFMGGVAGAEVASLCCL